MAKTFLQRAAGKVAGVLSSAISTPGLDEARARLSPTRPRLSNTQVKDAVSSATRKSVSAFTAPTQRAPEAKVKRAEPTKTVAPKTITSKSADDSWKSASSAMRKSGSTLTSAISARDAAKKSGDKAAYAKAQNSINEAYGSKKRY